MNRKGKGGGILARGLALQIFRKYAKPFLVTNRHFENEGSESMTRRSSSQAGKCGDAKGALLGAFTLVELLVVVAIIAILASLLFSGLSKSKGKAQGIVCLNNIRQLALSWMMYAHDNNDRLIYNLGGDATRKLMSTNLDYSWVNNVMTWELDSGNTNLQFIRRSKLSLYNNRDARIYRCPGDRALSEVQREAGWRNRVRSVSMNAMVGHAGELMYEGANRNNPEYIQFLRLSDFRDASSIFVFLDEHPDSINDGYFLNQPDELEWVDLPGSYHNHSSNLSFADGHVASHKWLAEETRRPSRPFAAPLPFGVAAGNREDFQWIVDRTSVAR